MINQRVTELAVEMSQCILANDLVNDEPELLRYLKGILGDVLKEVGRPIETEEATSARIDAWFKMLLLNGGIRLVNFSKATDREAAYGLINVPAKYVRIIDSAHVALQALAHGEPLPQLTLPVLPPPKKVGPKKRR